MQIKVPAEIDTMEMSEKGVCFPILSLTTGLPVISESGTPMTITALGSDSDAYQRAALEVQRKRAKMLGAGLEYNPIEGACELLAAVTRVWTGFETADGQQAQCTAENAKQIYMSVPEIRRQIDGKVHNPTNFTKASSLS